MIESGSVVSNLFNECLCHFKDLHAFEQGQWAHGSRRALYDGSYYHVENIVVVSCDSQEPLGNIFSFALLSLPYSILHVPRVSAKTSFSPEPTQPTSTHWLSDSFSLSIALFPPKVFSRLPKMIPPWSPLYGYSMQTPISLSQPLLIKCLVSVALLTTWN